MKQLSTSTSPKISFLASLWSSSYFLQNIVDSSATVATNWAREAKELKTSSVKLTLPNLDCWWDKNTATFLHRTDATGNHPHSLQSS